MFIFHFISSAFAAAPIMRHGVYNIPPTPPPIHSPTPSPPPLNHSPTDNNTAAAFISGRNMLVSVFLALFLPCAGMSVVFILYICLLWYSGNNQPEIPLPAKTVTEKGLSSSELERLPRVTGKELVLGVECAVCLDDIESEQVARIVPGCNHGFHLECADTWLAKRPVCPVCRAKLDAQLFSAPPPPVQENNTC
ncbi:E3 UBIQUITIN-PROTEIN LIGASE ATL23 [Salix purpurea]|uniref:E3 UBIQUITIN-PROTEIN LIGASE ATL23 n=1 Tax=Salix purpurea TaxID=77065 RepID=A0A9Q0WV83_SALPP|nr:E3 UBIQUITIN-PROTEIN LIGASE ATL23 [Salix purpurea]